MYVLLVSMCFLLVLGYLFYSYVPKPKIIWKHDGTSFIGENQTLENNIIFFRDNYHIYAADIETGAIKWFYPKYEMASNPKILENYPYSVILDNKIYLSLQDGKSIKQLDKNTGEEISADKEKLPNELPQFSSFRKEVITDELTYSLVPKNKFPDDIEFYLKAINNNKRTQWAWDQPILPTFYEKNGIVYFISNDSLYAAQ